MLLDDRVSNKIESSKPIDLDAIDVDLSRRCPIVVKTEFIEDVVELTTSVFNNEQRDFKQPKLLKREPTKNSSLKSKLDEEKVFDFDVQKPSEKMYLGHSERKGDSDSGNSESDENKDPEISDRQIGVGAVSCTTKSDEITRNDEFGVTEGKFVGHSALSDTTQMDICYSDSNQNAGFDVNSNDGCRGCHTPDNP